MLSELLQQLSRALSHSPAAALAAACIWGICSMVLSPCHLAGIPLIITYVKKQDSRTTRHAAVLSLFFAAGMLLMIALLGLAAILAGRSLGDFGSAGYYVVAVVFILIGLDLVDAITIPWFGAHKESVRIKGTAGALLLGLLFGLGSGPCTFAFLAPILAVTFQAATSSTLFGAALLLSFGIGHCALIVLAGLATERTRHLVDWTRKTGTARRVRTVFGILLILAGLYYLYRAI